MFWLWSVEQIWAILHGVLTISPDIGRFEQYHNVMYPTRRDKFNWKNNWPGTTWFGLAQYKTDLTLLEITPISSDIARYRLISPNIASISPDIAWYRRISGDIAISA